jgi:hypothetical protein
VLRLVRWLLLLVRVCRCQQQQLLQRCCCCCCWGQVQAWSLPLLLLLGQPQLPVLLLLLALPLVVPAFLVVPRPS